MNDCPTCHKGHRAVLYCLRPVCGLRPSERALTALPRPEVKVVTTDDGKSHVVISRDNGTEGSKPQTRSYEIEGVTPNDKVRGVVEKIVNDRFTGEWLP